jgi:hypothetical protein
VKIVVQEDAGAAEHSAGRSRSHQRQDELILRQQNLSICPDLTLLVVKLVMMTPHRDTWKTC